MRRGEGCEDPAAPEASSGPSAQCADGGGCEAGEAASASGELAAPEASSAPPSSPAPGERWILGSDPAAPELRSEPFFGVLNAGIVVSSLAHTYSLVVGVIFTAAQCCRLDSGWPMFLPLGGYFWPAFESPDSVAGALLGIPGAVAQTLGLVLVLAGGIARRGVFVARAGAPDVAPGPGDVGASLRWIF
ncbi:MAG: hypothetical protein M5U28_40010 [Sandaracinaceae bacterium]|nr:hypothetical protein [Sandaracinaceae bacterium]